MVENNIMEVSDSSFETDILKNDKPALVDFWAAWCGPCRAIAPAVKELADAYAGRLKVAKLNVDENPATPSKYGIRAIPTLLFFKNGKLIDQITGAVSKNVIEDGIKKIIE